jgi:hypothetical protein
MTTFQTVSHQVQRLVVPVAMPFDTFRARYEAAVPEVDLERLNALVAAGATWESVLATAAENAPHRLMRYWSFDVAAVMGLAGHPAPCVEYLMGNHTIAERMYRYEPVTMLYAPLRTMIYETADGAGWFAIDRPSTSFASLGLPEIAEVGLEIDRLVAELLETLGAPVPRALA